jgi:hypothetical protein
MYQSEQEAIEQLRIDLDCLFKRLRDEISQYTLS